MFKIGFFISVVLFGFSISLVDNFLHTWDEQFHALVAKNMVQNPLRPELISNSAIPLNFKTWTNNQVWIHKQPLFLWQISLSLKLFGNHILAVRIPSIILHALTTLMVFAMAKRFLSNFFAVLCGVLYGFSGLLIDFVSGTIGMDHNDTAFIFYVNLSFWAWFRYRDSDKLKWVIAIGLACGAAILIKWLVGMIVFAGWGIVVLWYHRAQLEKWKHLIYGFTIVLLVVLPWQIYCYLQFPAEFAHEMRYNSYHFFQVVENHGGDIDFYFEKMKNIFGQGMVLKYFVLLGIVLCMFQKSIAEKANTLFVCFCFLFIYGFFTVAATKLEGYVLIVAPFGFIFLLIPFDFLVQKINSRFQFYLPRYLQVIIVLLIGFIHFSPKAMVDRHNFLSPENKQARIDAISYCENIVSEYPTSQKFIITGFDEPIVPALRFLFDREIYNDHEGLDTNKFIQIDLSKFARPDKQ